MPIPRPNPAAIQSLLSVISPSGRPFGVRVVLGWAAGEEDQMTHRFHTYDAALAMVAALRPVLAQLAKGDQALTDQLRRAAGSVALNLAEGNRRTGQDRMQFFRIAAGSAAVGVPGSGGRGTINGSSLEAYS